eukprot:TRINITY_DN3074_c4_g1_i1.p1 TRINITY_DN3074_c4_g1~~TRINITY_DN3074_c4_g1_i1.p1  ORF type:complete len:503 (-),score=94.95 TRINITY_DN3074_c4_g1_i1:94-1602(-)
MFSVCARRCSATAALPRQLLVGRSSSSSSSSTGGNKSCNGNSNNRSETLDASSALELSFSEKAVFDALRGTAATAKSERMWVTGGWVRDKLLESTGINLAAKAPWQRLRVLSGHPWGDIDILVDGVSANEFYLACKADKGLRTLLRSQPYLVAAKGDRTLSTVKLRLPGHEVDVTSLTDAQLVQGRSSEVGGDPLREDAQHRDTTFNALYFDLHTEKILDPTGRGLPDLRVGHVRMPHPLGALPSVQEDPLRLLRTFRFAARFGFSLDDELKGLGMEAQKFLQGVSRGRVLYEVKKALLLHNQPSRFLDALSPSIASDSAARSRSLQSIGGSVADVSDSAPPHEWLLGSTCFGGVAETHAAWPAAVGRVRRLETFVLEGLSRGLLTSRSVMWRGRRENGPPAALLATDWRKTAFGENDWAELLIAALLWRTDEAAIKKAGDELKLSGAMINNIMQLQMQARSGTLKLHTATPGAWILRAVVVDKSSPVEFWNGWPSKMPDVD